MTPHPLRLHPGDDLRDALDTWARAQCVAAAFVISGIGSVSRAAIRFAGVAAPEVRVGDFELLSLAGTLSPDGAHLHATLSGADGALFGGHVAAGCRIRTTAEILVVVLENWSFAQKHDAATGYSELAVRHAARGRERR
jgi:predicted DNA-binding protein with PD1-like motif